MNLERDIKVRVSEITEVAERIRRFRLVPVDGGVLPAFFGGSHITVIMHADDRIIRNSYSLMSSPLTPQSYEISVLRTEDSRGGSQFMHERIAVGSELTISHPSNLFPTHQLGRKHLLIAGGIGITPFIAMMEQLDLTGQRFELHYAMRDHASGAYAANLVRRYGDRIHLYRSRSDERVPLAGLLEHQRLGTHLYVCGPKRMIDAVLEAGQLAGWPDENLHAERFESAPPGEPFDIGLGRSGGIVHVRPAESMLEALEAAGMSPNYLCRGGACGQCETGIVRCDGTIEHHDHYLTPEERATGRSVMICMSRFTGRELVLDL
jgi:ferredoxin-NADP reductase